MTKDQGDVVRLKEAIEAQSEWGPAAAWHSQMFDELSTKIFEGTGVMLSAATLKRFFGVVRHEGAPSITTLNTLSKFAGYENWTAFRTAQPTRKTVKKGEGLSRKSVYITIGFILATVVVALLSSRRPAKVVIDASSFSFSSRVLGYEYPNSVVFDFEFPSSLETDSLHIQQYWDPTKTIKVRRDQQQATGIYYFPGYFKAQLIVDGQSVLAHDLFLKSQGWLGTIEYSPIPKYFLPQQEGTGYLQAPSAIITEVRESEEPQVIAYHWIDDLGNVSGDDFTMEATVQNTFNDRWAVCQSLQIYFIGTTGAMIVPFSKIGCASDNMLMLNDQFLSGKENDLSAFSTDISEATVITISNKQKEVTTIIGGQEVHRMSYDKSMGRLVGIRFKFLGLGTVSQLSVMDQREREVSRLKIGDPL